MKALLFATLAVIGFAGCSTHPPEQIAAVRAAGVSRHTVHVLEHEGVLAPEDIIELRARGVPDRVAIRQLEEVGVDYAVQSDEIARLRRAGVSAPVRNALARACEKFIRDHPPRGRSHLYFGTPYYDDDYYGGLYGGYYGYPYYGSTTVLSIGHDHWRGGGGGHHYHGGRHR